MLQPGPRNAPPYVRPLKKKGFKEDRVTTIGLYDIGTSTTLESNKSLHWNTMLFAQSCQRGAAKMMSWSMDTAERSLSCSARALSASGATMAKPQRLVEP